jgi:zinc D-Ala-D-Ala dipeptidase
MMSKHNVKVKKFTPRPNTNTRKKRFIKNSYIISAFVLFVILLTTTLVIGLKNTKDHTETIKQVVPSSDPHFFITQTPTPSAMPTDEIEMTQSDLMAWIKTRQFGSTVNVRLAPDANSELVGKLDDRKEVNVLAATEEQDDGHKWYKVTYMEITGFVRGDFIALEKPSKIPDIILGTDVIDEVTNKTMNSKLDYVSRVAPNVISDLSLAKSDNFIGKRLYSADIAMVQRSTGEKLRKAADIFEKAGYQLVLWDAYRPFSATVEMYEFVGDPYLVANPKNGSKHNRGAAVDVTLYLGGKQLDMPTQKRVLDIKQCARNSSMSQEQRAHMEYLEKVMVECGFEPYANEWWHFNDTKWEDYPVMDFPLTMFD